MVSMKICRISWNIQSINVRFPKLLLTLRPILIPTLVGCIPSASRKHSKPLYTASLQGMHLAILFTSTKVSSGPLPMRIDGTKTSQLMRSSLTLLITMMAFLVASPDAPWHKSTLKREAPRLLHAA